MNDEINLVKDMFEENPKDSKLIDKQYKECNKKINGDQAYWSALEEINTALSEEEKAYYLFKGIDIEKMTYNCVIFLRCDHVNSVGKRWVRVEAAKTHQELIRKVVRMVLKDLKKEIEK